MAINNFSTSFIQTRQDMTLKM